MPGMCCGQNCQFQHVWDVSWSKLLGLTCFECVVVKIVSFCMAGMCLIQNRQFQHE
jgi:hypothetical protein